ncbi:MAG: orotate phosphoribosyltransferase [Longimicrobiales bacterium]
MKSRDRLRDLLAQRSVRLGDFTLSSGAKSSYYIDARLTTMSAEGQRLVGEVCLGAITDAGWTPSHIGGLTLGADPITYAIAHHSFGTESVLDGFTVRKAAKGNGTGRQIEGGLPKDADVIVIEDSVTSGGSALQAAQVLHDYGVNILGVLALVDREEGGRERIEDAGYKLVSVYRAKELVDVAAAAT